ncbi:MAG: hypothetical protein K8T89_16350 [Planctomycetes bacterium]|nr:hypothetical protein [Planctomycetota bacterium]
MRFSFLALLLLCHARLEAAPPVVLDDRLVIEQVVKDPDIVTPTGMAVDEQGRIWVIENHTHQRTDKYKGPATDRIRVFSDPGPDGKMRKSTIFADGFKDSMSLALHNGEVLLATRSDIWVLRDTKNTGTADERKVIVKLDSPGNYPHNGLSGFAFDGTGHFYFSLGENLGAPYKLRGSDGQSLSGGGEGGSIYRCRLDGSRIERVATGFWNTFHLTFDAFGRLFAVDNDPDARGPCRLLHVVEGGDYGYRFRNGRRGLHPFTAWNGELPGTLPMVAGTAEAPSGILAYESNGLPAEYRGRLLVTSWGDHVVEQFTLKPQGASFTAKGSVLVKGGEDFRPVAIVTGPDGSIYLSDWVNKSYPVHGQGAIWRIRMKNPPKDDGLRPSAVAKLKGKELSALLTDPRIEIRQAAFAALPKDLREEPSKINPEVRTRISALWVSPQVKLLGALTDPAPEVRGLAAHLLGREGVREERLFTLAKNDPSPYVRMQAMRALISERPLKAFLPSLADQDPFLMGTALSVLGRPGDGNAARLIPELQSKDPRMRLGVLLALRQTGDSDGRKQIPTLLADADPGVRRAAIQWVAEEKLKEYHPDFITTAAAKEPTTRQLFEALLAANEILSGNKNPKGEISGEEYVAGIVKDAKQPAVFRTFGLRMLRPDHPVFTPELFKGWLQEGSDAGLRHEAIRTLAMCSDSGSQELLRGIAKDAKADADHRAFAVLGLAQSAGTAAETRRELLALLPNEKLQRDVLRSLREVPLSSEERKDLFAWWDQLPKEKGGPSAERRELAEQLLLVLGTAKEKDDDRRAKLVSLVEAIPADEAGWRKVLAEPGDAKAGERVFLHPRGPRCAVCHRIDGRGGLVGPELSAIAKSHDRAKLIESILTPSKEIAPMFTSWSITMTDGKKYTGVILGENFDSTLTLADAEGKRFNLKKLEIEERLASPKSLMPDNLHLQMTRRELRDLLEFLGRAKQP